MTVDENNNVSRLEGMTDGDPSVCRGGHSLIPPLMTNDGSGANLRRRETPSKHTDARVLFYTKYGTIELVHIYSLCGLKG